jgi:hypothetical protein
MYIFCITLHFIIFIYIIKNNAAVYVRLTIVCT